MLSTHDVTHIITLSASYYSLNWSNKSHDLYGESVLTAPRETLMLLVSSTFQKRKKNRKKHILGCWDFSISTLRDIVKNLLYNGKTMRSGFSHSQKLSDRKGKDINFFHLVSFIKRKYKIIYWKSETFIKAYQILNEKCALVLSDYLRKAKKKISRDRRRAAKPTQKYRDSN